MADQPVLRLTQASRKLAEARRDGQECYESPPSYSSAGYKFTVRLWLNGAGDFKGSRVSLFLSLVSGDNDHRLSWPFSDHVTFALGHDPARRHLDSFRPDPTFTGLNRPIPGHPNKPFGCPAFASQDILGDVRYVQDDTLEVYVAMSPRVSPA